MTTHALYSASSLDRLAVCPISARLAEGVVEPRSPAAEKGTRIHAIAEKILTGEAIPAGSFEDEIHMAMQYTAFVEDMLGDGDIYVEVDLSPALKMYNPSFGGTADAVIRHNEIMDVIDLKTGTQHITPKENKQLLTYGLGALDTLSWIGVKKVRLHIWQPGNVSSVEYPVQRLKDWAKELVAIGNAADDPFAKAVPTKKGCYYCKGKAKCDALRELAVQSARQEFSENELEKLLDQAEIVGIWVDAIKEHGKNMLANGANGGHWQLKPGRKMTGWANKDAAFDFFRDFPEALEVKSVAQVKKLGLLDIPLELIEEKESAPSLVKKDQDLV